MSHFIVERGSGELSNIGLVFWLRYFSQLCKSLCFRKDNKNPSLSDSGLVTHFLVPEKVQKKGLMLSDCISDHQNIPARQQGFLTLIFWFLFSALGDNSIHRHILFLLHDSSINSLFFLSLPNCVVCNIVCKWQDYFFASSSNHLPGTDEFRMRLYNGSFMLSSHKFVSIYFSVKFYLLN